jgi:hypothetical protein
MLMLGLPFGLAYVGFFIYAWTRHPVERKILWAQAPQWVPMLGFLLLLLGGSLAERTVLRRIEPCDAEAAANTRFVPKHLEIFRAPILHPGEPIRVYPRQGEPTEIDICMVYDVPDYDPPE